MTDHHAATRNAERAAAAAEHVAAARAAADVLVHRTRWLISNGIDLGDPTLLVNFANDQVIDAVKAARVESCCSAGASLGLLAELARRLAETGAGR